MQTIKAFAQNSHLDEKLIRAVVRQFGGWEYFTQSAADVASHGADAGYSGFTYYGDTCGFYAKNQELILDAINEMADQLGEEAVNMVQNFRCLGKDYTTTEIGQTLYGTKSKHQTQVANALAWFALEEVARSFVDSEEA